ncbi:MAG: peptidoglycan-binding protein [Oscillospiraceae bacterium]|nr:peptidoglycan-binding protein [Oscillospiraceae bacterium]
MTEQDNIRTLQTMLRVLAAATNEIPSVIPDGIYGTQTETAVRAFQAAAGLPVTGRTDAVTWQSIVTAYERLAQETTEPAPLRIILQKDTSLGRGSRNGHVPLVQAMLLALSRQTRAIPSVSVTGVYDAATETAIRKLQQLSDLPQDGQLDRATWAALAALYRHAVGDGNL